MKLFVLALTTILAIAKTSNTLTRPSFLFLLGDDIGWGDMGYNNGTAHTPNIDAWARRKGTILMQDFHSGGTVCSPTRATVLTGRNHFRDCVNYVYGCSDMTECVPNFEFAPQRTFTIGDAFKKAQEVWKQANGDTSSSTSSSLFTGKWHLGSFYNDSEALGGRTSSPVTHGFQHFNATVEVSPTATTNCQCNQEWFKNCNFGHYDPTHNPNKTTGHCSGGKNPGGGSLLPGCCFNYWWNDDTKPHAVTNLTNPSPDDDTEYQTDAFTRFLEAREGEPFLAQLSFHNCHIPFIGTAEAKKNCRTGKTCRLPEAGAPPYTDDELDFYACLTELDAAVGRVLNALDQYGYGENTMTWFTTDNGPEVNCPPLGICPGTEVRPAISGPGSAGPLRGRKRDIWEGGHRVPGIISYPAMVPTNRVSWETVVTYDFLPTVMELLNVQRPADQQDWTMDGVSIVSLLKQNATTQEFQTSWNNRGHGWMYMKYEPSTQWGWGYRYGDWKMVNGGASCRSAACKGPLLYNLAEDLGERHDLSKSHPDILKAMQANFTAWQKGIIRSRDHESKCQTTDEVVQGNDGVDPFQLEAEFDFFAKV